MKIGIHKRENSYSDEWIEYCNKSGIPYKIVNCYDSNILDQLHDCDALMWHFHHAIPQDILFATQLMHAVASSGKYVFPDFNTMWHFDDKIAQKYVLEAIDAPLVPSYVFFSKKEALEWIKTTQFPKVFKLRVGASSQNVRLIKSWREARKLVRKAFCRGFIQYNSWMNLKESIRKYGIGETKILDILKAFIRIGYKTEFEKFSTKEKGYVYFQDFIANNDSDIRIVVVDQKAFGAKRFVRKNDFRASGSHVASHDPSLISHETLRIALDVAKKLGLQCVAYDFVYENGKPLIVEFSYGTTAAAYKPCPGYWDSDLNFHPGEFNFCDWLVDNAVEAVNNKKH